MQHHYKEQVGLFGLCGIPAFSETVSFSGRTNLTRGLVVANFLAFVRTGGKGISGLLVKLKVCLESFQPLAAFLFSGSCTNARFIQHLLEVNVAWSIGPTR